ncbi:MAG: hypothetical protein JWN45_3250 [Acidobacteriaceae bacterium]|nr:hypothetical protein [Acidobacteriaceae bacterium]
MLANAIESYVETLGEREFDAPFIALLRLHNFTDIHFLHGAFEFGKDFIAKRVEEEGICQYVFQTKAGNIGLTAWNECRGQIDMLRTNALAHPNFDATLPRRAIFAITGQLIGGASLAAQEYKNHLQLLGEIEFLTWDKQSIIEMIASHPGSLCESSPDFLKVLGSTQASLNFQELEKYSRKWIREPANTELSLRDVLESAVLAHHCDQQGRCDLACYVALMIVRGAIATAHESGDLPEPTRVTSDAAIKIFRHYAMKIWDSVSTRFLSNDELVRSGRPAAGFVTYPVRCLTIVEILSLLALLELGSSPDLSKQIADYVARFVVANEGVSHPISDRWGISLALGALLLFKQDQRESARNLILSAVKWIADRYEGDNFGLAGSYATPEQEVAYLMGSPFEHIKITRRPESYIASQILDICAVVEESELYNSAMNEFLAVGLCLPVMEMSDTPAQYSAHVSGQSYEPNMPYEQCWLPSDGWKVAPHHKRGPSRYFVERAAGLWEQIALSCVVRDRHSVQSWRRLLVPSSQLS